MKPKASPNDGLRGTVLVTDTNRGSAIAIIRSLGRRGWRVVAADSDPRSLGFRSRYARERLLYPAPRTAPGDFIETLYRAVQEHGVDLVIPVTDEVIHPLARARARFEPSCKLALAADPALEVVTDKARTLKLAQELGVPVPPTRVVRTAAEAREAMALLRWPVVLKPAVSRKYSPQEGTIQSCSVSYASSLEELADRMREFDGRHTVLLQEYCAGSGEGVELLAYRGRPLAAFQHRRLAEVPLSGGAGAWRESVPLDPDLYGYAARLVAALGWTGLIMVEFKVGAGAWLMEINGRVWGSLPLAVLSGMDFPARLADLYFSGPPPAEDAPATDYRVGVRAHNLELSLSWIAQVLLGRRRYPYLPIPKRRRALAAALGLLRPGEKLDIASLDDPMPGLAELPKIARKFLGKLSPLRRPGRTNNGS
jgi:predicted ATP-grasp superfamily ATP-dependent carboligase